MGTSTAYTTARHLPRTQLSEASGGTSVRWGGFRRRADLLWAAWKLIQTKQRKWRSGLRMAGGKDTQESFFKSRAERLQTQQELSAQWRGWRRAPRRAGHKLVPNVLAGTLSDRLWTWIVTILDVSRYSLQQMVRAMTRFTRRVIQRNMDLHGGTELEIVTEVLGIQEEPFVHPLDDWRLTRRVWYELPGGQRAYLPSLESSLGAEDDDQSSCDVVSGPSPGTTAFYADAATIDQSELPRPACE